MILTYCINYGIILFKLLFFFYYINYDTAILYNLWYYYHNYKCYVNVQKELNELEQGTLISFAFAIILYSIDCLPITLLKKIKRQNDLTNCKKLSTAARGLMYL